MLVVRPNDVRYGVHAVVVTLSDPKEEYEEAAITTSPLSRLTGQAFPGARYRPGSSAPRTDRTDPEEIK